MQIIDAPDNISDVNPACGTPDSYGKEFHNGPQMHSLFPAGELYYGDVLERYDKWPAPQLIISDGAYGIRGFKKDASHPNDLPEWYKPHLAMWDKYVKPNTTLWFWNTEIGWAIMHPILEAYGWKYIQLVIWDKGIGHIAGNINGSTIRQLPIVTEVCALYRRNIFLNTIEGKKLPVKDWLRHEWQRSGLPLCEANIACQTKNAATRKYLTSDDLWYWPPGEAVEKMALYCKEQGRETSFPYFSLDGMNEITADQWDALRPIWNHKSCITNVWSRPPLSNKERIKGTMKRSSPRTYNPTKYSAAHLNQKPLDLMERQILAATKERDTVWEPFGGLASAAVAAIMGNRIPYVAEIEPQFFLLAKQRLENIQRNLLN